MSVEATPRSVSFRGPAPSMNSEKHLSAYIMERPLMQSSDSDGSGSSVEAPGERYNPVLITPYSDNTAVTTPYSATGNPMTGASPGPQLRGGAGDGESLLTSPDGSLTAQLRQQRPLGPARTPSNTYAPARFPLQSPYMSSDRDRSMSTTRLRRDPNAQYRAQEKAYMQRLRQGELAEYFEPFTPGGYGSESDDDGESPTSEFLDSDAYDQETLLFYGNEEMQPDENDIKDPDNRERLEWHGMLASVLTGDVVRQEKKRLTGAAEKPSTESHISEIWLGLRAKLFGRAISAQRRLIDDERENVDKLLDEIIKFQVRGESETGKAPLEQVREVVDKIDKCESLYPTRALLLQTHNLAQSPRYSATCDAVIAWNNTTALINTELSILQKWVGNAELDFGRSRERSPGDNGLSDETSFIDRLFKEDGLKSLQGDVGGNKSMLNTVDEVIMKAKSTLIENSEAFAKRHLPPYIEELLTLISFPSRLVEEIIKVRLAYAKQMKESAKQSVMMREQMMSQFQVLLNLAVQIKLQYNAISQPEPGWDLPPCIDESFDQVVIGALKYYFKMINWKLGGNKNTFKEAEVLEQEWEFANTIAQELQGGDVEVAEQFCSITHKAVSRLSQTYEREMQMKENETVAEMDKRFKQTLESVRGRHRMLQRFARVLRDRFESATDFSIAMNQSSLQILYDRLIESGHFMVETTSDDDGIYLIASPTLFNRFMDIQTLLNTTYRRPDIPEDPTNPYMLIVRPETQIAWGGRRVALNMRSPMADVKIGHLRLLADGSQLRLANTRRIFLESIDLHLDMVVEQRSNLHKVNLKLMDIRKVAYKLSNTIIDSVETVRRQTHGLDCQDLVQTCFVFATEFGQRSTLYMDRNRRQMNNIKLTKLALDWICFICDDCIPSDKKTFKWAVTALEFSMLMTQGRHILALGDDEYARLRAKVATCMSLLISHFDIMGARSTLAAQAEKERMDALAGQFRNIDRNKLLPDEQAFRFVAEQRQERICELEETRKERESAQQVLGKVLEESNEADRSLAYLSASATNVTMRWQQGPYIGGGTFGSVYAAMNIETGYLMAVKEIRLQDPQLIPTIASHIRDEMSVLQVLDHPNIVSYYGIEVHRDKAYIFMEYCSGGSLASLLEHGRIEDETVIMVYVLQLLEGLAYLHSSGIVHRDIKPENVLLDHNGVIKYVDFGAAKVIARKGKTLIGQDTNSRPNKSMTGTPMYMSPELIKGESHGRTGAVDVWSLGCVILEMATGRRPWATLDNEWAIMYNIAQGNPPQLPTSDQLSESGIDFLKKCFIRDPNKRASATELLQHEWIIAIRSQVSIEPITPSDSGGSSV